MLTIPQKKNNVKVFDDNILLKNKRYKKIFLKKNKISKLTFDYIVISPGIDIQKCKLKNYLLKNQKKNEQLVRNIVEKTRFR